MASYTPTQFTKNGATRTARTWAEDVYYRFEGWQRVGDAPPDPTFPMVRRFNGRDGDVELLQEDLNTLNLGGVRKFMDREGQVTLQASDFDGFDFGLGEIASQAVTAELGGDPNFVANVTAALPEGGARAVGKNELFVNAKDHGVVGDGVVDDTVALNAAAADALALGADTVLFLPRGNYKTTGPVTVMCQLDASQATILYAGTGEALRLGSPSTTIARKRFSCPRVTNTARGNGLWDGTSVGIKATNINSCIIDVPFVADFETGFFGYGDNGGFAYNTINLGTLWYNHNQFKLQAIGTGWANQNVIIGGRMQHVVGVKGATALDTNARQIWCAPPISGIAGPPNSNTFINTSLEDTGVCEFLLDDAGYGNSYIKCRWERPVAYPPKIRWRAGASNPTVDGGYDAVKIIEQFDGPMLTGVIRDGIGGYSGATISASGQLIPNSTSTNVNTWNTPVSRRCAYDPATGFFTPRSGRWTVSVTVTFAGNVTGRRLARLVMAGNTVDIAELSGSANLQTLKLSAASLFNGQQTFYVSVQQTSGADLALVTTSPYTRIDATYIPS